MPVAQQRTQAWHSPWSDTHVHAKPPACRVQHTHTWPLSWRLSMETRERHMEQSPSYRYLAFLPVAQGGGRGEEHGNEGGRETRQWRGSSQSAVAEGTRSNCHKGMFTLLRAARQCSHARHTASQWAGHREPPALVDEGAAARL